MILLYLALLWPAQVAGGQFPELGPGARLRVAVTSAVSGDDGAAVTHLLLFGGRHPGHPLAPLARLGAAWLSERKGDFIAAIVHYRKAEEGFLGEFAATIRERRVELELELSRLPVQVMRRGRRILAADDTGEPWRREAGWFIRRFKPNPLSGRLKLRLAGVWLRDGRRSEALALTLTSLWDPGVTHRRRAAATLAAWQATPSPGWLTAVWSSLLLVGAWSLVRLWQFGPSGWRPWGGIAAGAALILAVAPTGFAFFPLWFLLAAALLWVYGFPRVLRPSTVAGLATAAAWITACALVFSGRWPW